jgi:hypothetical protein
LDEREMVDSCLRETDFLSAELARLVVRSPAAPSSGG